MNKENERKLLIFLDIVGLVLSVIGVIVLTVFFKLDYGYVRYFFLLGDILLFKIFSIFLNDLEIDMEKPIMKYSKGSIENKYLKKVKLSKKYSHKNYSHNIDSFS